MKADRGRMGQKSRYFPTFGSENSGFVTVASDVHGKGLAFI